MPLLAAEPAVAEVAVADWDSRKYWLVETRPLDIRGVFLFNLAAKVDR